MRAAALPLQDLRAIREGLRLWLASRSTRFALFVGVLTYLSYASMHGAWANPMLLGVSLFVALALPWYSRASNLIEQRANHLCALITVGRLARGVACNVHRPRHRPVDRDELDGVAVRQRLHRRARQLRGDPGRTTELADLASQGVDQ